jgi:hypothetical protein
MKRAPDTVFSSYLVWRAALAFLFVVWAAAAAPTQDVVTWHNDNARTGGAPISILKEYIDQQKTPS